MSNIEKWIKEHKKELFVGCSIALVTVVAVGVGYKLCKDGNMPKLKEVKYINSINDVKKKYNQNGIDLSKYNHTWFGQTSLEDIEKCREIVRKDGFCNPNLDDSFREECHRSLDIFDKYIREKRYGKNTTFGSPVHTSHGWYLPSD